MADLAKVKLLSGDRLETLLELAGFLESEIPGQLERVARANGMTLKALDELAAGRRLWVPKDLADTLPPDRRQSGVSWAKDAVGDTGARSPAVVRSLAIDALTKLFDGCEVQREACDNGFKLTVMPQTGSKIIVEVAMPPPQKIGRTDPPSVTMTNALSSLSASVELDTNNVATSIAACNTKLEAVHEYASTLL